MMDFACWKCVEVEVRNPGEMCTRCFESDDRAQRDDLERGYKPTPERKHRDNWASFADRKKELDRMAVRDWENRRG